MAVRVLHDHQKRSIEAIMEIKKNGEKIDLLMRKKIGTRMLKCECTVCGYIARTTRRWIRDVGPPSCPNHGAMVCEE